MLAGTIIPAYVSPGSEMPTPTMDDPVITVADAAIIASVGPRTLRTWIFEGWIGWKTDLKATTAGATTFLSKRSVYAVAIAVRLTEMGMTPSLACHAARRFTDKVSPTGSWDDSRAPGELYSKNLTVLVAYPDGEANVLPADKVKLDSVMFAPGALGMIASKRPASYVIYLGDLVKHVDIATEKLLK